MKITNYSNHGLFGSTMNWINARLPYLYKHQIYPEWDIRNVNHGDPLDKDRVIPYIICPKKQDVTASEVIELTDIDRHSYTDFKEASFYFNHYFKFSKEIIDLSYDISKNFKNCLGVHLRGYDKLRVNDKENTPISNEEYIKKLLDLSKTKSFESVFILSDDAELKSFLAREISINFKIPIHQTPFKTIYHIDQKNRSDKLELTKESVAEMLALSKCKFAIKNHSAFSSWAKIINPSIEMYRVTKCKQKWFPDYYLPEL